MQPKPPLLASQYQTALQDHLRAGPRADEQAARDLGKRALSQGLETLDLALLHAQALHTIPNAGSARTAKRSRAFFAQVMMPLEESRAAARHVSAALKGRLATLTERSRQLAASNDELTRELGHRRTAEARLQSSEEATQLLLQTSRHMQAGLLQLSQRLLSSQEKERREISHELHAVIASTLTGVLDRLSALKEQTLADTKAFHRKIAEAQKQVVKSVQVVQRFARDLRPAVLDDLGLVAALQSLLKECRRRSGRSMRLVTTLSHDSLTSAQRLAGYRVAQEALNNAVHHARNGRITVRLQERDGQMLLEIQDSGPGFDLPSVKVGDRCLTLGLLDMRQRVEMVGGQLAVASSVRSGTTIRATLPMTTPAFFPPPAPLAIA